MKSNQYLTDRYGYIIVFYCFHNDFSLVFVIKVFIIKVSVTRNYFAWNLQRDELLQCWKFAWFIFSILCNISIILPKKRGKLSIAVTSSNFILCSLLGGTTRIYLCSLLLIYIKSNHLVSTVKQLAANVYWFGLMNLSAPV